MGSGSNLLVSDHGLKAAVVRLSSAGFRKVRFMNGSSLEAGSGVALARLISAAKERQLSGLEFLSGIPGTLGGALAMNAGAAGECIGGLVNTATVMDFNGAVSVLNKKRLRFAYRRSNLSRYIILSATLGLKRKSKLEITRRINRRLDLRRRNQDLSHPSAGCIFKNPGTQAAGRLIDLCGLKGTRRGDAAVSGKHANFIINLGRAKASDVLKLMAAIKRAVKAGSGVNLESEIRIWRD